MALSLAQQVEAVAEALDEPLLAVVHTARNLGPSRWATARKGVRGVRAEPRQLWNLGITQMVGPPKNAAAVAGDIGDLPIRDILWTTADINGSDQSRYIKSDGSWIVGGLPVAPTFGETQAARIEAWARADRGAALPPYGLHTEVSWPNRTFVPSAVIRFEEPLTPEHRASGITRSRYELFFYKDHPTRTELGRWWRTVVLRDELLCALADIWRTSAPDVPAPKNENAETPPARDGSAPTPTQDRSRNGEKRALPNPDVKRALSLSQERVSPSGGHPVPLSKGKDPPWPTTTNTTTI